MKKAPTRWNSGEDVLPGLAIGNRGRRGGVSSLWGRTFTAKEQVYEKQEALSSRTADLKPNVHKKRWLKYVHVHAATVQAQGEELGSMYDDRETALGVMVV